MYEEAETHYLLANTPRSISPIRFVNTPVDSAVTSPLTRSPRTYNTVDRRVLQRIVDVDGNVFAELYTDGSLRVLSNEQPPWLCDMQCCLLPCWCQVARTLEFFANYVPECVSRCYLKVSVVDNTYLSLRRVYV
jgi:hypothetical protein